MKKTYQPKQSEVIRSTHTVDATGKVVGRLASQVATLLMGKHKANYSAHMDSGDRVVVKNGEAIVFTGRKNKDKVYQKHSGFPGGFKEVSVEKLRKIAPNRILEQAVYNMLPANRLRSQRMARLRFENNK